MNVHGYELIGDWENSTCGKIATGTRGGRRYFLKMYQTPVKPINNGTLDAKTYAHNEKLFNDFVSLRKTINTRIRPLAGPGGNIVIPCEEFVEGNHFVEVSEFVEGAIPKSELVGLLASLSLDTKKLLMKTAAGALASVHSKHVIHSDLKLENLLLVRNAMGNYVAKMLDFDSSYTTEIKPDEIIGTIEYYSPELGAYGDAEDDAEEMKKFITEKTDIFSLGLIYHYYFVGAFPEPASLTEKLQKRKDKGKIIYPWVVLNSGCELQISPEITSPKYISLISDMLSRNPEDRPTAAEVLRRLQASETADTEVVLDSAFPEHGILLDKEKINAAQIIKVEKHIAGADKKYRLLYRNGKKEILSKDEMIAKGYAKNAAPIGWPEPWPEHSIEFDTVKLSARGFVSGEREMSGAAKGYNFYQSNGKKSFFKPEMLIAMRYAKKVAGGSTPAASTPSVSTPTGSTPAVSTPTESVTREELIVDTPMIEEPWEEHNLVIDEDVLRSRGFVGIKRCEKDGKRGYLAKRTNGVEQFLVPQMLVVLKIAKNK